MPVKKKNKTDFSKTVSLSGINGVKTVIASTGIIATEKEISDKMRSRIHEAIKDGLDNIADGWAVEGEYKDNRFYVYFVINDKDKILNVDDTIAWASIMGYGIAPIQRGKPEDLVKNSNVQIRNEKEFSIKERLSNVLEVLPSGNTRKPSWRERIQDALSGICPEEDNFVYWREEDV